MRDEQWTAADDAVEEVREVRRQLWECFDNDPVKYGDFLRELCDSLARAGLIKVQAPRPKEDSPAA